MADNPLRVWSLESRSSAFFVGLGFGASWFRLFWFRVSGHLRTGDLPDALLPGQHGAESAQGSARKSRRLAGSQVLLLT